jgi:hypothetical protein
MRWAALLGTLLLIINGAVVAQSVDQSVDSLETCFQAARLADPICEKQTDPGKRLDCFNTARATQLECLAHILPGEQANSTKPEDAPPSEASRLLDQAPTSTGMMVAPTNDAKDGPSRTDAATSDVQISARGDDPTERADVKAAPMEKHWIIGETTSPVDFSALVTAAIEPIQRANNGPSSLIVRCRAKRTELALQFSSAFDAPKGSAIQIEYQIEAQPSVKQQWSWSATGKVATYRDDPAPILQSIPEGARLTFETSDNRQAATFQLIGLDAVRKKVGAACKWAPLQNKAVQEKR